RLLRLCRRLPPSSTLFPYTTLFRSAPGSFVAEVAWSTNAKCMSRRRMLLGQKVQLAKQGSDLTAADQVPGAQSAWRCHPMSHTKDRKSTRLNSSHVKISYAVFCLKK